MRRGTQAIVLIVLCTLFTSLGQILWKFGIARINVANILTVLNLPFIVGCISYGIGAILMILAFKKGQLSVLYPILATSYIWVSLLSPLFFPSDSMNPFKWAGVLVILFSVSMLGFHSNGSSEVKQFA